MKTIYKFEHEGNIYIGSTTNFKERCWAHNQHKKQLKYKKLALYKYCNHAEIDDIRPFMSILEEIDDDDIGKLGLRVIEQSYMDTFKSNLNLIRAISKRTIRKNNLMV
jgi:hypothetical protein